MTVIRSASSRRGAGPRRRCADGSPRRARLAEVAVGDAVLERAAGLCMALGTDGLRGELTLVRAARAIAALDGNATVGDAHLRAVATSALRHRLRRNPLDETASATRIERVLGEMLGP
jgi:magnesium chelatase subunit I